MFLTTLLGERNIVVIKPKDIEDHQKGKSVKKSIVLSGRCLPELCWSGFWQKTDDTLRRDDSRKLMQQNFAKV